PARQAARTDVNDALRHGARGAAGGGGTGRLRSALVVAQIAAALALLVGAGLLGRTLYNLRYASLRLRPDKLLTVRTVPPSRRYAEAARRTAFYGAVLERVERLPGVVSAGYTTSIPLEWKGGTSAFLPEGPVDPARAYDANHRQVSVAYLRTMGIPLVRGRSFDANDGPATPRVAIVNETMARQYWPDADAVGKRFQVGKAGGSGWITI